MVGYTEIDWRAYMEQVEQVIAGERDYTRIEGGTGPLVYPAAHVYLYWLLYYVTDRGTQILAAQRLFGLLYLATMTIVFACYRRARAPLYVVPMLVLSKRLHSIFILRLFNDCLAVFFLWSVIYLFQRRCWGLGSMVYSWGLGIKMSLLLTFPAIGALIFLSKGVGASLKQAILILLLQILIAMPFLLANPWGYLGRAFELTRKFNFRWTVNWRFLAEETFLSQKFSAGLLIGHMGTLVIFVITRWLRPAERPLKDLVQDVLRWDAPPESIRRGIVAKIDSNFILTAILTANAIGFLFARSLHYQFFAYITLATPFLLWRAGLHPVSQYILWAMQEWAWNVYPSTKLSSMVVVGVQLITVVSIWWRTKNDFIGRPEGALTKKKF
ncbi:Dol-P-Man:Man(5)GlcNAc(2)-PP-Dol alpha-1,3-mannosyltransferase [Podosphaera aphanis]|nr:Dol-P-Man:Man(5)GlcNAc(2)-PP-Dol alpha-1,3-mannosyltransferase [Podosphaera aphanis]